MNRGLSMVAKARIAPRHFQKSTLVLRVAMHIEGPRWVKTRKAHFEQFSAASPRTADMTDRAARVPAPREACRVSVCACTNHRNGLLGKLKLTKCAPGGKPRRVFSCPRSASGLRSAAMHFCLVARKRGGGPALLHSRPSHKAIPVGRGPAACSFFCCLQENRRSAAHRQPP